jgi:hypothetical protein
MRVPVCDPVEATDFALESTADGRAARGILIGWHG